MLNLFKYFIWNQFKLFYINITSLDSRTIHALIYLYEFEWLDFLFQKELQVKSSSIQTLTIKPCSKWQNKLETLEFVVIKMWGGEIQTKCEMYFIFLRSFTPKVRYANLGYQNKKNVTKNSQYVWGKVQKNRSPIFKVMLKYLINYFAIIKCLKSTITNVMKDPQISWWSWSLSVRQQRSHLGNAH